jgi:hypothetical protein
MLWPEYPLDKLMALQAMPLLPDLIGQTPVSEHQRELCELCLSQKTVKV